jgi:hypothetical protein
LKSQGNKRLKPIRAKGKSDGIRGLPEKEVSGQAFGANCIEIIPELVSIDKPLTHQSVLTHELIFSSVGISFGAFF